MKMYYVSIDNEYREIMRPSSSIEVVLHLWGEHRREYEKNNGSRFVKEVYYESDNEGWVQTYPILRTPSSAEILYIKLRATAASC